MTQNNAPIININTAHPAPGEVPALEPAPKKVPKTPPLQAQEKIAKKIAALEIISRVKTCMIISCITIAGALLSAIPSKSIRFIGVAVALFGSIGGVMYCKMEINRLSKSYGLA